MRRPISRVRSVTETSMMFIMPTPPTTSEIMATTSSRLVIESRGGRQGLGNFGHVADVEVVVLVGVEAVPLAQQGGDLVDGRGICSALAALAMDLIDVGRSGPAGACRRSGWPTGLE